MVSLQTEAETKKTLELVESDCSAIFTDIQLVKLKEQIDNLNSIIHNEELSKLNQAMKDGAQISDSDWIFVKNSLPLVKKNSEETVKNLKKRMIYEIKLNNFKINEENQELIMECGCSAYPILVYYGAIQRTQRLDDIYEEFKKAMATTRSDGIIHELVEFNVKQIDKTILNLKYARDSVYGKLMNDPNDYLDYGQLVREKLVKLNLQHLFNAELEVEQSHSMANMTTTGNMDQEEDQEDEPL